MVVGVLGWGVGADVAWHGSIVLSNIFCTFSLHGRRDMEGREREGGKEGEGNQKQGMQKKCHTLSIRRICNDVL